MTDKPSGERPSGSSLIGVAIVVAAITFVAVQFFAAARETLESTRDNACRALFPQPLPKNIADALPPDFALPDANGKTWSLAGLRGRPVLLNFWATWCPPCVEEMPSLEELARKLGDEAVVLAVSVDEGWDPIKRFFHKGTNLSIVLDQDKAIAPKYGTEKYPETFLINAEGKVERFFQSKRKWDSAQAQECVLSAR